MRAPLTLLAALIQALRSSWQQRHRDEGLSTLEMAVIALGVLGLAIALVATLTTAINSRLSQIL